MPETGKHVGHYLYQFDRSRMTSPIAGRLRDQFVAALDAGGASAPERLGVYWIAGHRADFGIMAIDDDPAKIDAVHQRLMAPDGRSDNSTSDDVPTAPERTGLGGILTPTWSFVSMSEISEYVLSPEDYRTKLIREGADPDSPQLNARVSGYERRLPMMNAGRLCPEIPDWPAACFYPMNKIRDPGANWFTEPFSARQSMMSEHAASGIEFAGRVTQLISVGVGFDDWEWMVTLWARNPQYLKDIVYRMRFDIASAKYAQFGPFYTGYKATADEILEHCRLK